MHYRFDKDCVFTARDATEKILTDIIDNSPCNKIYKKEVWKAVRFPVGRRFEDVATIYKTFYNAEKTGYIKKYYYNYVKHKGSAIDLSFDAQRRYECFLGYKERYDFSRQFGKETIEKCKALNFLHGLQGDIKYLSGKNKLLLWGIKNCSLVNKVYGKLSLWSKKIR